MKKEQRVGDISQYKMSITVKNYDEIKELVDRFKKEVAQLEKTVEQLQKCKIDVEYYMLKETST